MAGAEARPLLPRGLRWAGPLLAPVYGLGVGIHRAFSKKKFAPIATICVGNLTAGGTGKTPAVIYFARELAACGRKPAILMRGYKAQGGDEAEEAKAALRDLDVPILLGGDRYAGAIKARELGRDVVLLDDGFQHWRLARDLDVVLIDATDPFGSGALIPAGRLREPAGGLARAGVVVLTRSNLVGKKERDEVVGKIKAVAPGAAVLVSRHVPSGLRSLNGNRARNSIEELRGKSVMAACGIGNPGAFRTTLEQAGARVDAFVAFDDHHEFTAGDVAGISNRAGASVVVVTEKDAVKIEVLKLPERPAWWALGIRFQIEDEKDLWARVEAALRAGDARAKLSPAL